MGQLPDYHLQVFDYSYGIRAGNILGITKDRKGFFWILYPRYVQRFDGRQVKTFQVDGYLNYIFCDNDGQIWVTNNKKVYRFVDDNRAFREVQVVQRDSSGAIGPVFQLPDRSVWLLCTSGFYRLDPRQQQFSEPAANFPLAPPLGIRSFAQHGNTVFFAWQGRIIAYNFQNGQWLEMPDQSIRRIFPINDHLVVVTTWRSKSFWYNFLDKSIEPITSPPGYQIPSEEGLFTIHGLGLIQGGRYLMLCRQGIFELSMPGRRLRRLQLFADGKPVFANDFANYLFIDSESYAWLATINGIARFPLLKQSLGLIRLQPPDNSLLAAVNNVRRIVEDKRGNLWLATGNGLACWQAAPGNWIYIPPVPHAKDRLAYPSIRGLVYDGKYLILGPADLGVWLYDPETRIFRRPRYPAGPEGQRLQRLIEGEFIDEITTLQNGNHLIMGRDALYVLDGSSYELRFVDVPPARENTNFAFQAPNGLIWLTTAAGLHCLDSNLNYLGGKPMPVREELATCGFMLPSGKLIYASFDGLQSAEYRDGQIHITKLTDVFDHQLINTLYQDAQGVIWATGDAGIFRFDQQTGRVSLLDHSDNIQGYGFNSDAWYRDRNGRVFFGGSYGMNYVIPEYFQSPEGSFSVFIQNIKINSNDTLSLPLAKPAHLKSSQRSLEIEFTAPYFNNPEKIKYRYWLDGYDTEWKSLGNNNFLRLTSLPSGDYTLRVQASLNGIDWIDAEQPFRFHIAAPFWQRRWFIAACMALFIGLVYAFAHNRNQKLLEKQEELEAEQAINYFATSMYERASVDEILWDVARNCIGRLQFEDCVIYLLDESGQKLVQKAAHGPKSPRQFEIVQPLEVPLGKGIVGSVAVSGQAELIHDTRQDPRYIVDDQARLSEIAVPISLDGKVLGVIDCEHSKLGFFTQKHLSILTTIASLCANKITRAKAEAEKEMATRQLTDTRQKMQEVEMQALRAQMNPHFIFNCLNSINRYIVKSDQATASLYLTRFAKLIRLILDNSNNKNVALSNELEALRLYIEMESLRFAQKFTYTIDIAANVSPDSIEVPPLIIQPFVENAIWHGLLHKEEAGNLFIHLEMVSENMLQCTVEDNGIGRQKARELKSKSAITRKSLGMQLTEDRLSLLNKHAQLNASVNIIDLIDPTGAPAGTKVILTIPV